MGAFSFNNLSRLTGVALLASCSPLLPVPPAEAQITATVVSACGTPPGTYSAGQPRAVTQDTTGKLCDQGGGGGGGGGAITGTAAASSVPVTAGTGKPFTMDLFSDMGVIVRDAGGNNVDWNAAVPIKGSIASGTAATDNPIVDGGRASTTIPTAVGDGTVVAARLSKLGNTVTSTWAPREQWGDQATTITASTAAATCVTAGATGVFRDIVSITINDSAATDTVVQILDDDGSTVRWTGTAKANDMRGIVLPQPLKEAGSAVTWKCKTVTSTSSVVFTLQYSETK